MGGDISHALDQPCEPFSDIRDFEDVEAKLSDTLEFPSPDPFIARAEDIPSACISRYRMNVRMKTPIPPSDL